MASLRTAAIVGLVALGVLLYVNDHRSGYVTDTGGDLPIPVLVAKHEIQKGTTGAAIQKASLYRLVAIRSSQIERGALINPSRLVGKVVLTAFGRTSN